MAPVGSICTYRQAGHLTRPVVAWPFLPSFVPIRLFCSHNTRTLAVIRLRSSSEAFNVAEASLRTPIWNGRRVNTSDGKRNSDSLDWPVGSFSR